MKRGIVLANSRQQATMALEAQGLTERDFDICTSPDQLRGLSGPVNVRRIGKPFSESMEAELRAIVATGRTHLSYGL